MRIPFIILAITTILLGKEMSHAQNFIGMHKDDIMQVMKDSQKRLKLNTSAVNPHYNYLKYEDKISEITVLFFLSDKDRCTLIRKMCDYSNINEVISELNSKYKTEGNNKWYYMDNGKRYSVVLTEEDWFFTVTTKLDD